MKFKSKICTTKEQSERLLKLGLKKETADCQYAALIMDWKGNLISNPKWRFYDHNKGFIVQNFEQMKCIPAWSLHRLVEMIDYFSNIDAIKELLAAKTMFNDRLYDRVIDIIEYLINNNNFNKDYLEEKL